MFHRMTLLAVTALLTLILAACFGRAAAAQVGPNSELSQDRREVRQDRRQKRDDRRDLVRVEALLNDFDRARRHGDTQMLRQVDTRLREIMQVEVREGKRETRQDRRELGHSRREVRSERRERRTEYAQGDIRGTRRATRDVRDDRRDKRDDRRDLARTQARTQRRSEIRASLVRLYGKYDPVSLKKKRGFISELVLLARAELQDDRRELREDKRERREGWRERRQDRRR